MSTAVPAPTAEKITFGQRFNRMDEGRFGLLLIAPTAIIIAVFLLFPIVYALVMSMQQIELTVSTDRTFVGLRNYYEVLNERALRDALGRTLFFTGVAVVSSTVLSVILALVLNEPFRGRKLARVLVLLPWAVAPVVNGVMWRYLFHPSYGLINAIMLQLGLIPRYQPWLDNPTVGLTVAALATAWKQMPFLTLVTLAALQAIPDSLYRAAKMDGAGIWARFTHVTLPHLRGIIVFIVLLQTIVGLQAFDLIFTLTRGGPAGSTMVLSYLVYANAFERLALGKASAMATLLGLLILALSGTLLLGAVQRRPKPTRT
jgi:multiple sugar transport system permease protein